MKFLLPLALLALAPLAHGAVIFSENFGTTQANPTTNPFTVQQTWNYSDSAGTTVDANESRLFQPSAGTGSNIGSVGWISLRNGTQTFQQIQSNNTFSGLATLGAGESYQITLNWFGAAEASVVANDDAGYVSFTSAGKTLTFLGGSNGVDTDQTNYASQILTDSNASPDAITMNYTAYAGGAGKNPGRTFSAKFTTTDALNGGAYSVALGLTSGPSYIIYDDVSVDVTVIPEPSSVLLLCMAGGLGLMALARRRRCA